MKALKRMLFVFGWYKKWKTEEYYKDLIVKYIATYGRANRNDIRKLLWDKLSDVLKDEQKESKIKNLLQSMRRSGVIVPDVENSKKAYWILSVKV